mmetsp:Transcript_31532/g.27920  ORF Transcript_31532/g.27920 Transcript_31532/m.27920 type:complete len:157 (-) Transcript_31532:858-1328(-)
MPYLIREKVVEKGQPIRESTIYNLLIMVVFCIFPLAGLFASIYSSKYLAINGAKVSIYIGLLGLTLHFLDALLPKISSIPLFISVLLFNRVVEGFSYGLIQSVVYGVSSQELAPEEFDIYARTCSAFSGLGSVLSLILSPFLFSIGGYSLPYYILS